MTNIWSKAEAKLGAEGAAAMRKLYDFYGKDVFGWLADLYDRESGMYYYANSARDNEGFLPDIESTAQTHGILLHAGMFRQFSPAWTGLTEEMRSRTLASVQSMQDRHDGYFYHPQWGSGIGAARRGRDLNQALYLIETMGGKPLYPTALERLEANASAGTAVTAGMPAHLASEEAMLAYMENLNVNRNSYSTGHNLSSQANQIKAAGLADFVLDYLTAHQNSATGLWEEEANYQTLSGVIKIGALYGALGRAIPHGYEIVDSAIDVILSREDTAHICLVFNPLGGLGTALRSIADSNAAARDAGQPEPYDLEAIRAKIIARLPEIVDATIEKLTKYHHPDGSFSYQAHRSSPYTQGTYVSLGLDEGDVNATAVGMHYILNAMWGWFGMTQLQVPMCDEADYAAFMERIRTKPPVKKIPRDGVERINYSVGSIGFRQRGRGNWHMDIQMDPAGGADKALRCCAGAEGDSMISYQCRDPFHPIPAVRSTEWEIDLYVHTASEGVFARIGVDDTDLANAPLLLERQGSTVVIRTADGGQPCASFSVDTWISLRLAAGNGAVSLSADGKPAAEGIPAQIPAEDSRLMLVIPDGAEADFFINNLWGRQNF
ncbi:MAG: hypothetical protein E7662_02220 [Ruminococcaceae bacterium]|nr:hypothetical protein [Oscillospiraceae bacterium]